MAKSASQKEKESSADMTASKSPIRGMAKTEKVFKRPDSIVVEESKLGSAKPAAPEAKSRRTSRRDRDSDHPKVYPSRLQPNEYVTVGEDFIEISRIGDENAAEERAFDPAVDKSVVESDYSDDEDGCFDSQFSGARHRQGGNRANRGFLKGCYVPAEIE